jgi:hypothetical protein
MKYTAKLLMYDTALKVQTIKALKVVVNIGLKEAKDLIDGYTNPMHVTLSARQIVEIDYGRIPTSLANTSAGHVSDYLGVSEVEPLHASACLDLSALTHND